MHHGSPGLVLLATGALLAGGCGNDDLEGHYWAITARGAENGCTDEPADTVDKFEYRLQYDGTDVEVAIGPDVFAEGVANGCQLAYESIIWTEESGGYEVACRIIGSAIAQQGGTACAVENGTDWDGTEIFEVVTSEHPDVSPGCQYEMTLEGKYLEQVK